MRIISVHLYIQQQVDQAQYAIGVYDITVQRRKIYESSISK
jgi:hypothetical protein